MVKKAIFLAFLLILQGCSATGRMASTTMTPSGQWQTTLYSDIYEKRQTLIPDQLGIQVLVQDKKSVGPLYKVQQALGALGPSDLASPAECLVLLFNRNTKPMSVVLSAVRLDEDNILSKPMWWNIPGMTTEKLRIPNIQIYSYGTQINFTLELDVDGQAATYPLTLRRLTEQEADDLFEKWSKRDKNTEEFFQAT